MIEIHYVSLIIAALAAFVASFIWYIIFAKQRAKLSGVDAGRPRAIKIFSEFIKNIVLASALLYLIHQLGVQTLFGAVHLTLLLWVAFPVLLLMSSVMYEKVPPKLAAIHAGDWLIKLLLTTAILSLWH